jgi:hypothetical protein
MNQWFRTIVFYIPTTAYSFDEIMKRSSTAMDLSTSILRRDFVVGVTLILGVVLTVPAITGILPLQYAAPFEWVGVFCLMNGLTCLFSPRRALGIAFTAFLVGTFVDPIVFRGQSFQMWLYANAFVFIFASMGMFTSSMIMRFRTVRS